MIHQRSCPSAGTRRCAGEPEGSGAAGVAHRGGNLHFVLIFTAQSIFQRIFPTSPKQMAPAKVIVLLSNLLEDDSSTQLSLCRRLTVCWGTPRKRCGWYGPPRRKSALRPWCCPCLTATARESLPIFFSPRTAAPLPRDYRKLATNFIVCPALDSPEGWTSVSGVVKSIASLGPDGSGAAVVAH